MPRPHSWIPRIGQILGDLRAFPDEKLLRSDIERIFQIGGSSAKALMAVVCAGLDDRDRLRVTRADLLQYLECSPEGMEISKESARRRKFAANLTQVRQEFIEETAPLHESQFRVPERYKKTRLRDLPRVTFEPGELRVRFTGREDLASTLLQLAEALQNDWHRFESTCDFTEQSQSSDKGAA